MGVGDAGYATANVDPMPFEKAGESFPGSAFYYLAAEEPLPRLDRDSHSDAEDAPVLRDPLAGPTARALYVDNSGVDRSRALQCMTAAIYYEARSEPDAGQRAVAQVVLNRVAHPSYPNTVCGVVYQGSQRRTGCQFSFTCDGSLARIPNPMFWLRAENVARAALSGYVYGPVGLATHYHTIAIHPYWAPSLSHVGTIGAHRFYRFGGAAGQPGAFRFAYAGGEPGAAAFARNTSATTDSDAALDPLALQKAFESGLKTAQASASPVSPLGPNAPLPNYAGELQPRGSELAGSGEKLPQNNQIKPEFQNSGRWIVQPGT